MKTPRCANCGALSAGRFCCRSCNEAYEMALDDQRESATWAEIEEAFSSNLIDRSMMMLSVRRHHE